MAEVKCAKCHKYKDTSQFHKHSRNKSGVRSRCKSCRAEDHQQRMLEKADRENHNASSRRWYRNNTEKAKDTRAKYREIHSERVATMRKNWEKANKDRRVYISAKYRAKRLQRTPKWLTNDDHTWMSWYYLQAQRLTEITGIKHEVDHIYPLQGSNLSGLHVPWNLQILTKTENATKGNR